ncbi:MAG TPA: DUF983 domain-containing protein, partial [Phycisphaerae bacterium]|nr:DUF983 domain-containing protein [Phycisphaerae bacterium]
MATSRDNLAILWRGMRRRCPQCGRAPMFTRWANLRERCDACGLELKSREPDIWFITYTSTAFITGLFIVALLFILPTPENKWLARTILGGLALCAFIGTAPMRKGLAIALDYLIDLRASNHES